VERFFNVTPFQFLDIDGNDVETGRYTFPRNYDTQFSCFENWYPAVHWGTLL